jgi:hypothetical protein
MEKSSRGSLRRMPTLREDGRCFICFIDNSRSMRDTKIGSQSLFSLQVQETNRLIRALKVGKTRLRTWVLFVTFDGALEPGWQPLMDVHPLEEAKIPIANCSPVLDLLASVLDTFEMLVQLATGKLTCTMMLATDGLDGITLGGKPCSISVATVNSVRSRIDRFFASGFIANALAIGPDGGDEVSSFFSSLGFPNQSIHRSGLDPKALRRAFKDLSESSLEGLDQ